MREEKTVLSLVMQYHKKRINRMTLTKIFLMEENLMSLLKELNAVNKVNLWIKILKLHTYRSTSNWKTHAM